MDLNTMRTIWKRMDIREVVLVTGSNSPTAL